MKKYVLTFALASVSIVALIGNSLFAQKAKENNAPPQAESSYKSALGLRGGFEGGLTFKHFIAGDKALEFILSSAYRYRGYRFTGLYEIQKPIPGAGGLNWFVGAGAHIGSYDYGYYGYYGYNGYGYYDKHGNWHPGASYSDHYLVIGLDLIIGIEYKFETVPFTVGLDFKPYFDFVGRGDHYGDGAFTVRYIFK